MPAIAAVLGGFHTGGFAMSAVLVGEQETKAIARPSLIVALHTSIMITRRIARPLGAFAKEWTCPSCVGGHSYYISRKASTNILHPSRLAPLSPRKYNTAPFLAPPAALLTQLTQFTCPQPDPFPPWSTRKNSPSTVFPVCSATPATLWDGQPTSR